MLPVFTRAKREGWMAGDVLAGSRSSCAISLLLHVV